MPVLDTIKHLSDAPICLGGVGFSIFPAEVVKFCDVSYGICGDGEESLVKPATALRDSIALDTVPGLVWMENGRPKRNATSTYFIRVTASSIGPIPTRLKFPEPSSIQG